MTIWRHLGSVLARTSLAVLFGTAMLVQAAFANSGPSATSSVPARPSSGCALSTPATSGSTVNLLAAGGDDGAYMREIPPTYAGKTPMPVVVDLHGYLDPASFQEEVTQLGSYGDTHGFITITPQVAGPIPLWNTTLGGKDLAFIGGLLRTIDSTMCVDLNRIYVTGYSNGAFMTSSVACQFASQVAAVAPVAGIEDPAGCHPSRPVPVVAFHGTADPYVSYSGGLGPKGLELPTINGQTLSQEWGMSIKGPAVPVLTAIWAKRNHCGAKASAKSVASDVTLFSYSCPGGNDVELYRISGGGHAWPGSVFSKRISSAIGRVTFSITADKIIWNFFKAHPLDG